MNLLLSFPVGVEGLWIDPNLNLYGTFCLFVLFCFSKKKTPGCLCWYFSG